MAFLIGGANSLADTGYDIDNSLRFNTADSPSLAKTFGADGSATQFCISAWVKRSRVSGTQQFLFSANTDGSNYGTIKFNSDNKIQVNLINSGSDQDEIVTDAVYRDVSAWYHLFFVFDKTQAALSNGIKLYVNNVLQTWGTTTYAQNQGYHFGKNGTPMYIGNFNGAEAYADFYLSEVYYVEGELKNPTDFGEVNDNGVWIPKEYEGNFGDEGFKLEFKQSGTSQNSSGIGADTSGNDNHFAVSNLAATDVTTDTPTNNFATLNPLSSGADTTFSEGNTKVSYANNFQREAIGTITFNKGKWYAEMKRTGTDDCHNGIVGDTFHSDGNTITDTGSNHTYNTKGHTGSIALIDQNNIYLDGSDTSVNTSGSAGNGDIVMIAFDADSKKIWFGLNGTWSSSGDPANGTNPSDTYDGTATSEFTFSIGTQSGSSGEVNFGNPSFAISSGNADDAGFGNFEYDVPAGFYSLCTKNLAEFG